MKVSCDASSSYFHGLASTAFTLPSLTMSSSLSATDNGIVKRGFVVLDYTGKLQVIHFR